MSRTGYGLHRIEGGIRKRLRDALAAIPVETCDLGPCELPAAAVVPRVGGLFGYGYACAGHARQAERLGYKVIRRGASE